MWNTFIHSAYIHPFTYNFMMLLWWIHNYKLAFRLGSNQRKRRSTSPSPVCPKTGLAIHTHTHTQMQAQWQILTFHPADATCSVNCGITWHNKNIPSNLDTCTTPVHTILCPYQLLFSNTPRHTARCIFFFT